MKSFHLLVFVLLITLCMPIHAQNLAKISNGDIKLPVVFQNKLYFFSDDGIHGEGLYFIDQSDQMQFVVTVVGETSKMYEANDKLFFAADDGSHGCELWVSDGTTQGTGMVKDIASGLQNSIQPGLLYGIAYNNKFYFAAEDTVNGRELWASDGTLQGTQMVYNIANGGASGIAYGDPLFSIYRNALYFFTLGQGQYSDGLWVTDSFGYTHNEVWFYTSSHVGVLLLGDTMWIQMADGTYNINQIFLYDGAISYLNDSFSLASLEWVKDKQERAITYNGKMVLGSSTNPYASDFRYYLTDGTNVGTSILGDLTTNRITEAVIAGDMLFFYNKPAGRLHASNFIQPTIELAPISSNYGIELCAINDKVLFKREDNYGVEPWVSDGTVAGTMRLKDIVPGSYGSLSDGNYWPVVPYHGATYFITDYGLQNLWTTNGNQLNTQPIVSVGDTFYVIADRHEHEPIEYNDCLYMAATRTGWFTDLEVWKLCSESSAIQEVIGSEIHLYPNPVTNRVSIVGSEITEICVYDVQGKLVKRCNDANSINVTSLHPGTYFVQAKTKEGVGYTRFIKL